MKLKCFLLLLVVGVSGTGGARIFGGAGIDSGSAGVQAGVTFPKIPGINSPILGLSVFPTASNNNNNNNNNNWDFFNNLLPRAVSSNETSAKNSTFNQNNATNSSNQTSSGSNGTSFIDKPLNSLLPNITKWVPKLPNLSGNLSIPSIQGPGSLDSLPNIPGLSDAIAEARNHVRIALNGTENFVDGIETALRQALESDDPTGAVRTLVNTILDAYLTVAENCPMIVIATRVLREGIRLAGEVARSAGNVAFGP